MLLNWLWQGCLVTLATTGILQVMAMSAASRYALWWMTLLLVSTLPLALVFVPLATPAAVAALIPVATISPGSVPASMMATLAAAWVLWFCIELRRICQGIAWLGRARRACSALPVARQARLERWTALRLSGRRARLVISSDVHAAAVIGLGSPIIALTPHLLGTLDDADLDRTVLHEWAHVQRRDDVALLIELLVRAAAGWHPAIWWTLRQLRLERELACDDRAVSESGSAVAYAALLAKLADIRVYSTLTTLAPSAAPAHLAARITRLLDPSLDTRACASRFPVAVASVALVMVGLAVAPVQLVTRQQPDPRLVSAHLTGRSMSLFVALPEGFRVSQLRPEPFDGPARHVTAVLPFDRVSAATASSATDWETASDEVERSLESSGTALGNSPEQPEAPGSGSAIETEPLNTPAAPVGVVALQVPARKAAFDAVPSDQSGSKRPWIAAAQVSAAIGHDSQRVAVATASIFNKLSRKIAGSF